METKRSPYDTFYPSPSEELKGICQGITSAEEMELAFECIKSWMISHLSLSELERLKERDPLFDFDNTDDTELKKAAMMINAKWGKRVENGKFLSPLPHMKYDPEFRIKFGILKLIK